MSLAAVAWGALASMVAIAAVRTFRSVGKTQLPACCPHEESEAPDTVRGEFRPSVVR